MSSKKFKTYCRIIDYVSAVDPELAEIIRGTCTDLTLGSLRGKPGITFLMPQDKAFRKKLADHAYSTKIEEANTASDMINALIIRDVFKSPSDWMAKKDDIPNSLLPPQHVAVDSVSGNEIIFAGGAKAVLDTDFKDASRKSNLAVWKLTGEIPVTTDKPAKLKYAQKSGRKTGSYDAPTEPTERYKIGLAVENAYVLHELSRRSGAAGHHDHIYLKYILSLIHYIINVRRDVSLVYDKILPILSCDNIDFYFIVEPHKFGGNCLLDDMLIHEWWMNKDLNFDMGKLLNDIDNMLNSGGDQCLIYSNRAAVLDKIDELRSKLCEQVNARPKNCIEDISKEYEELEKNNTIGGLGPIYPAPLFEYYSRESGLKMLQDDLRYISYGAFKSLEQQPQFDMGRFHELTNIIGDYLYASTAEDRLKVSQFLNKNSIRFQINPIEKVQDVKTFINSTLFLYIPITRAEADSLKQKNTIIRPKPTDNIMYNIQKGIYTSHRRLFVDSTGAADMNIANILKSLDVEKLDPELRELLKQKLSTIP